MFGKAVDWRNMKRNLILSVVALAVLLHAPDISARKTIAPFGKPRPVGFNNHKGKTYTYYCLTKGQALGFAVEGPARIDIRNRAGLSNSDDRAKYQIQVWEGEYLITSDKFKSKAIDAEMSNTDLLPAAYRTLSFETSAGVHNYRLWLTSDNIDTVFIRIYRSDISSVEPAKAAIYPLEYYRRVHLYSKKNQTPYYLISKENGVRLQVSGPASLLIRARANFTADMDGRIGFSITILENDEEIKALSATTAKSLSMAYQDYTGVVPSKPTEFLLDIPAGNHIYNFLLKESPAETVSIRFSTLKAD